MATGSMSKGPGKSYREGLSLDRLFRMFPTDEAAEAWFTAERWPDGPYCRHCGSRNIQCGIAHPTMTHRCRDCPKRRMFSLKTGTVMQGSPLGYRTWLAAIYLVATNLKGVSSMKLHRDLGISQKSAWYLAHRIREAWKEGRRPVRRSGRGRRGLYRRQAQEHAEVQARGDEGRRFPRGQDHRRRRQGSTDEQGERGRGRGHGRLDAPELRRGPGHRRRQGLHRRARVLARVDLPRSRERQPLEGRVCAGRRGNAGHRVVLGDAQASPYGDIPQDQPEAHGSLCDGVRGPAQRPAGRHARPDGEYRTGHDRGGGSAMPT